MNKNSTQFELFTQLPFYLILSNIPFAASEIFFTLLGAFFNINALFWEKGTFFLLSHQATFIKCTYTH